ncbi:MULTISPECIES: tryptophan 2,3-dioxygenase family protein [Bradyrhizobium]|uniref:tryptophan 2,3-dioxygenase family protein n=1 Tax=Bradyrhizobium TaxID=374 RepID=UPI001CD26836|nr:MULTISPECIES: tryptophan 2,3-dioxygenase family protein [Bradyrhizobium]MCA1529414.1 hypothetical protein [Bradyrhizobium yuanmingense]MCA1550105.1 hypothetical protein [Bradyrhizobium sp. BRP19]
MSDAKLTDQQFSYVNHLQLEQLLSVMRQITPHPEEHIFITTHHALEIWFKHLIFDMKRIIEHLSAGELTRANWLLKRAAEIMRLAEGHWTVLETMSAADFLEFRSYLTGASGMQSRQFRELEVMCGLCETAGEAYRQRVAKAWPGLAEGYPITLRKAFFAAVGNSDHSLVEIYRDRWKLFELFTLAENAFEFDRRFLSWRHSHILMVRRQIGMRTKGTGGTIGQDYLASTANFLFFPELWELRHELTLSAGGEVGGTGGGRLTSAPSGR